MRFANSISAAGRFRRRLRGFFTDHPASIGETYFEHFGVAAHFSGRLAQAAMACACHAVFPATFTKTGSAIIAELYDQMVANRTRQSSSQVLLSETKSELSEVRMIAARAASADRRD